MKFISLYNIIIQSRLTDYKIQLKDDQLAQSIFYINDPKKQKMIIKWIKNGSIQYPKDIQIINKAYQIINRKSLDYNKFNSPQEVINQYSDLNQKINYNPDNESAFTNKVELGNGVIVYDVQDNQKGKQAVRNAVDFNFGKDANPWCIIARNEDGNWKGNYWNSYNAIPKRIVFKNGQLIAMCANNQSEIQWWDREDQPKSFKQITGVKDDREALQNITLLNIIKNKDPQSLTLQQITLAYQKLRNNIEVMKNIAESKNTPIYILKELSKEPKLRSSIAYNKNTPTEILEDLVKYINDDKKIYQNMISNPNCPEKILNEITKDPSKITYDIIDLLLYNPKCPQQILRRFCKSEDKSIVRQIAQNPNIPADVCQILCTNPEFNVRYSLSLNKHCSPEALRILSKDQKKSIVHNVAYNPNTPIEILYELIKTVPYGVLINPNCPQDILIKYSKNINFNYRKLVAKNPNTPKQILLKLSKDKNPNVIIGLASNPNCPVSIEQLINIYSKDRNLKFRLQFLKKFK